MGSLGTIARFFRKQEARDTTEAAELREREASAQRELARVGRELVRLGAAMDLVQAAVSPLSPEIERLEASLRAEAERQRERDGQLRAEMERAALEDMMATVDGLEAGLEEARELVRALGVVQRRLRSGRVQRWWRAMGEATGVKRGLPEVPVDEAATWLRGLELTRRRLLDALARRGVMPIEAVGRPFDPYLHEAVTVRRCGDGQDGLVLREERRGYGAADRVIRPSRVVVGRLPRSGIGGERSRPTPTAMRPIDEGTGDENASEAGQGQQWEGGFGEDLRPE